MALRLAPNAPNAAAAAAGTAALHAFMNANDEKKSKRENKLVKNIEKWLKARKSGGRKMQKQNIPGLRDRLRNATKAISDSQEASTNALKALLQAREVSVSNMEELKVIENVFDHHDWTVKLWISAPEPLSTEIQSRGRALYLPIKN